MEVYFLLGVKRIKFTKLYCNIRRTPIFIAFAGGGNAPPVVDIDRVDFQGCVGGWDRVYNI